MSEFDRVDIPALPDETRPSFEKMWEEMRWESERENLQTLCRSCNSAKRDRVAGEVPA